MQQFRTLIITAETVELARKVASALSSAGSGMWTTGLSSNSTSEPTHYISTGLISEEFAYMLPEQIWQQTETAWELLETLPGSPEAVTQACLAAGLDVQLEEIQEVFNSADVTAQDAFIAMQRLGLVLVQPEEYLQ